MSDTPVRLEQFGDVLTERDLCALMQWAPSYPRRMRDRAFSLSTSTRVVAPALPEPIGGWQAYGKGSRGYRYHRASVQAWLEGRSLRAMRRAS